MFLTDEVNNAGYSYTYTKGSGVCEFKDASNDYFDYDYDEHWDYDYAEEDKEECLQSCLKKSEAIDHAVGCYFNQHDGQCMFFKSGTIVGASGDRDDGTCWKFHLGNMLHKLHSTIIHHTNSCIHVTYNLTSLFSF